LAQKDLGTTFTPEVATNPDRRSNRESRPAKLIAFVDARLGRIPGIGDLTTPFFAALLLLHAVRLRIPRVVQLRMLINAAIDLGIGFVPFIGDAFDFGWKANVRNLALLERYARPGSKASRGDWVFVFVVIGVLAAVALIPLFFTAWLLSRFRLF